MRDGFLPSPEELPGVRAFDSAVDEWCNLHRGPALDAVFYGLSSAADHGLLWLVLGAARAARRGSAGYAIRFGAVMGVESALTNGVIKSLFRRVRPDDGLPDDEPLPYGMRQPITSSFPSGHATAAFTAASILARTGGPLGEGWFALAALVSFSRVYVRMHHASDVIVGAALGLVIGRAARRLFASGNT